MQDPKSAVRSDIWHDGVEVDLLSEDKDQEGQSQGDEDWVYIPRKTGSEVGELFARGGGEVFSVQVVFRNALSEGDGRRGRAEEERENRHDE